MSHIKEITITDILLVWIVAQEEEEKQRRRAIEAAKTKDKEAEARRQEMRKEAGLDGNANMITQHTGSDSGKQQGGWLSWLGWK